METCPLCLEGVKHPVFLKCVCVDKPYCLKCVLKWRALDPVWDEDEFRTKGRQTFAAPCPLCRSPLELGMNAVKPFEVVLSMTSAQISVMCMALTDSEPCYVFGCVSTEVNDEALVEYSEMADGRELDAIVHYVLKTNRSFELLEKVVKMDSIEAMTRFLKYVCTWRDYEWSKDLEVMMMRVMNHTAKWLKNDDYVFIETYAVAMRHQMIHRDKIPLLMDVLQRTQTFGSFEMHDEVLTTIEAYDEDDKDTIAGMDAIPVIAAYLSTLPLLVVPLLLRKRLDSSLTRYVWDLSTRPYYLRETCLMVTVLDVVHDEMDDTILKNIMDLLERCCQPGLDVELMVEAIDKLVTAKNVDMIRTPAFEWLRRRSPKANEMMRRYE